MNGVPPYRLAPVHEPLGCSDLIQTLQQAQVYYANRIAGLRALECSGKTVQVFFPKHMTHAFSTSEAGNGDVPCERFDRRLPGGRVESRYFSLDRARLMDRLIEAVEHFTVSIPGTGIKGHENRMLHGPRLADGRYLRVILQPGGPGDFVCLSAYPVTEAVWLTARRAKSAKFPP